MLDELLKVIPINDIAKQLGAPKDATEAAVQAALPALVSGLAANVANGGGDSLEKALGKHNDDLLAGGVKLADVDTKDGAKIVKNVFGGNEKKVVETLDTKTAAMGGFDVSGLVGKVLPILAPIVLSFLAAKFFGGAKEEKAAPKSGKTVQKQESEGGLDLGGLLGGLLGGGSSSSGNNSGGGLDLGGLVGGLLGGGNSGGNSGGGLDLGGLIGGLLGGGKK